MALDIISTINLDLKRPNTETVYAVQYDTAGRIKAQLTNDGEAWHVPTSAGGMVSFRKSDNIGGFYDTTELGEVAVSVDENDDSVIYIALDAQTTITATPLDHPVQMQINFYNSQGKRLSTFAFYLRVQASVLFEGDQDERPVASEWTFRILTGALGQTIKNQEEAIKWMEDNIRTQEGYVVDDTLKVEGAAGDAKKIGELFEEIVKISDSMPGYFPTTDTERVGNTKYYTRSGTSPNYVYTEFTGATFATGVTYYEYSPWNRIWIDPDDNDVAIPTMDDHNELSRQLSDVEENQISELKSAINGIEQELVTKENILDTSVHTSTNPAVTFNDDGTATIGTSSYGHTFWDSPKQLTKGTYELFGVPAGFSFISTSNNKNNAIVTNETNNGLIFDLQTTGNYYIGYYIGARPSASFNISPYLKSVEQKLEYLDDIKEDMKPASLSTIFNFERGNIATATGGDYNGDETYRSKNYRSKNFLDLSDYESTIKIARAQSNSNSFTLRVACYSGNDVSAYLGYHDFASTADISPEIVNGTKYVRLGIACSSAFTYSDDMFDVSYGVITHLNALVGKMQTLEGYNAPTGPQKVFCVMGYNAGEYGEVSAENYNSVLLTHQSMIARFDPDVMCVAEFLNTFGTENTETVLLSGYFKRIINNLPQTQYAGKAICCNVPMVVGNGTTIQFATNPSRNTYKTYAMLNGKRVCLMSTHLDYDTTAHIEGEMTELLSILQDEEYFILYGDFNCMTNETRELTYGVLEDAGYNLASSKTRGLVPTYNNYAIDNIVTSSNISIITVYADRQKYDNTDITNKDHNPIIAYVEID